MKLFRRLSKWLKRWKKPKPSQSEEITLPPQFDVFCIGDLKNFINSPKLLEIPGNLYVSGDINKRKIKVSESLFVDGSIDTEDYFYVGGDISVLGDIFAQEIFAVGNFSVNGNVCCHDINVAGNSYVGENISCFDIISCGHFIVGGNADCCNVNITKEFVVGKNIDAIAIEIGGRISYGGILDCDSIDIGNHVFIED